MKSFTDKTRKEMTSVTIVNKKAGFKKVQKEMCTPSRDADSTTIILAIAPTMVAFPAKVDAEAKDNQSKSAWVCFKNGIITMVKGTLLTT